MRSHWLLPLLVGCGGSVAAPPDSGFDGSIAVADSGADAEWWTNFPDAYHDPGFPPWPGEYPPRGLDKCYDSTQCYGAGGCDVGTGWCCNGSFMTASCRCGDTLGCLPPAICCAKKGDFKPHCEATRQACTAYGGMNWP